MRAAVRAVVLASVCLVLAVPASASQLIHYRGSTAAPRFHRVEIVVIKRADGDRFITDMEMRFVITCEDLTTQRWAIGVSGRIPVQGDGTFNQVLSGGDMYWAVDGALLWGKGSGTTKLNAANLTADGQDAQLCTSGDLMWHVDRVIAAGAPRGKAVPDGVGVLKLYIRHGVAEVVKLVEP